MAPGDLNLKKSWHPGLMKNQQKVWEFEQEALLERKKIQERQQEIAKEKELAELRALQYGKTGKAVSQRMDWMYDNSGIGDGGKLITGESEEYLLGKKRVDDLILNKKSDQGSVAKRGFDKLQDSFNLKEPVNPSISRDDPMAKIREQQLKKLQERKLKSKVIEKERPSSHRSHHHHHHRHRSSRESGSGSDRRSGPGRDGERSSEKRLEDKYDERKSRESRSHERRNHEKTGSRSDHWKHNDTYIRRDNAREYARNDRNYDSSERSDGYRSRRDSPYNKGDHYERERRY